MFTCSSTPQRSAARSASALILWTRQWRPSDAARDALQEAHHRAVMLQRAAVQGPLQDHPARWRCVPGDVLDGRVRNGSRCPRRSSGGREKGRRQGAAAAGQVVVLAESSAKDVNPFLTPALGIKLGVYGRHGLPVWVSLPSPPLRAITHNASEIVELVIDVDSRV